ncbi:hypothetical protein NIES2100_19210 [Calothrix sp. NIES-2100]|uniref:hypothetical protein n=1 Tax=Calothrix sp. NIES-2100 TaxID=1954172 RepID=UPI000B5E91E5|nr:hypothetical protein NIES2100_19210 [Calothrix sp. NIES-2100]
MYASLQNFPPITAEGFATVKKVDVNSPNFDISQIFNQIQLLPHSLINRTNRDRYLTFHAYIRLLDFERLMYLISLIIRYPGIGNLQATNPSILEGIFGDVPQFTSALAEITAIIGKLSGHIYADAQAIASDLHWLQENSLININTISASAFIPIVSPHSPISVSPPHAYSDVATFQRLIAIIRFILQHPFLPSSEQGSLQTFVCALRDNGIIDGDGLDTVRKDIERVLKPYKILPDFQLEIGSKDSQYVTGDRSGV